MSQSVNLNNTVSGAHRRRPHACLDHVVHEPVRKVGKALSELGVCKSRAHTELHSSGLYALLHHLASQAAQPALGACDLVIPLSQSKHCQAAPHIVQVLVLDLLPDVVHGGIMSKSKFVRNFFSVHV